MSERVLGKNVKRLMAYKVSRDAIPDGGGMVAGIAFILDRERMIETSRKALEWVDASIQAIRDTYDNPYGDDEETIAGAILEKIEGKK